MSETPENLVDLLNKLQEVPDPPPVSMMPQTPGWIVLGVFLIVGLLFLARAYLHRHRANAYRRAAMTALSQVGDDPAQISAILKRAALVAYPRQAVAPLTGSDWPAFLERTGRLSGFVTGPGAALATASYVATPAPSPGLNALAVKWLRQHQSEGAHG